MDNSYAGCMQAFFDQLETSIERDPVQLALSFANYFRRDRDILFPKPASESIISVSILAKSTPLEFLTKRISLVSDVTVLTHYTENQHAFSEHSIYGPQIEYGNDLHSFHTNERKHEDDQYYLRCPDVNEVGTWLQKCKPLLTQGEVFYYPDIISIKGNTNDRYASMGEPDHYFTIQETKKQLCDIVVSNRKVIEYSIPNIFSKSKLISPIVTLDLPYIENVDLRTYSKIMTSEHEAYETFKNYLRVKFLDLYQNEGSEHFESNLAKISLEIRDGVRKLNHDMDNLKRKTAFQVTEAAIATTTATLVTINSAAFDYLPTLLGTSGGLFLFMKAIEENVSKKKELEYSPFYYLWLFSKKR